MRKIKVTIWNEYVHEQSEGPLGDYIRKIYPRWIHEALREALQADDLEIRTATLDMPEQGLPEGYGFQVERISYDHTSRSYTVVLRTARQYLGDVTGYQAQVEELQAQVTAAQGQAAAAAAELTDQEAALAAAYTEGVESIG